MTIDELNIGQSCSLTKRFSTEDVNSFAELSLDNNPLHVDKEYAEKSVFKSPIVHGFLLGSLFLQLLALCCREKEVFIWGKH